MIVDIGGLTDQSGRPLASLVVDGAPLPKAVLDQIRCTAGATAMLFDGPGRSIWAGRDERNATIAQWRALIARDRGCVGCSADPNRCEAHHILEWDNWGLTDIDNLVLVCTRCHHDIHHRGAQLRRTNGRWHIDPAHSPPRTQPPTRTARLNRRSVKRGWRAVRGSGSAGRRSCRRAAMSRSHRPGRGDR
ncbi:MAG: HNH endonuclease signature motif containing protein [Acidimicrobiales bacterium]